MVEQRIGIRIRNLDLFAEELGVGALGDGDVVEFTLLLTEEFEPALSSFFNEFRDAKGQGSHEIITRGSIPIPHLD